MALSLELFEYCFVCSDAIPDGDGEGDGEEDDDDDGLFWGSLRAAIIAKRTKTAKGHSGAPIFGQNHENARLYLDISPKIGAPNHPGKGLDRFLFSVFCFSFFRAFW